METNAPVSRIRKFGCVVAWPSMRQMNKRGCTPYFETAIGGHLRRVHFFPTSEMRETRPYIVHVTMTGNTIKVAMSAEDKNPVFGQPHFVRNAE